MLYCFWKKKSPRTGGIILANISSREEAEKIIKEDPFYQYQVADYDIMNLSLQSITSIL